jgi:hypothetical protein
MARKIDRVKYKQKKTDATQIRMLTLLLPLNVIILGKKETDIMNQFTIVFS